MAQSLVGCGSWVVSKPSSKGKCDLPDHASAVEKPFKLKQN